MAKCEACGARDCNGRITLAICDGEARAKLCEDCATDDQTSEQLQANVRARRAALAGTAWEHGEGVAPTNAELFARYKGPREPDTYEFRVLPDPHEHDWGAASQVCNRCDRPRHQYEGTRCAGVADVWTRPNLSHASDCYCCVCSFKPRTIIVSRPSIAHPPEPATCRDCSSPATVNGRCVYCQQRTWEHSRGPVMTTLANARNWLARSRMADADKRTAPRITAISRELAKWHPSTWPSQEGEE